MKKTVLGALLMVVALVFMIPAGLAFAMPGFESGSSVELNVYNVKEDPFLGWYGWWGERLPVVAGLVLPRVKTDGMVLKYHGRETHRKLICGC